MAYNVQQRAKCAAWFENMGSVVMVQRNFHAVYGKNETPPSDKSIKKWHNQLMTTGSVMDKTRERSRPATSGDSKTNVMQHFSTTLASSLRRASLDIGISHESVRQCLKEENYYPLSLIGAASY